jgi:hypothetical protein
VRISDTEQRYPALLTVAPTSHDLASNRGALETDRKRAVQVQVVRHVLLPFLTGS